MESTACERHGLRYDPRDPRGCVLCRRRRARGRWALGLVAAAVAVVTLVLLGGGAGESSSASPAPAARGPARSSVGAPRAPDAMPSAPMAPPAGAAAAAAPVVPVAPVASAPPAPAAPAAAMAQMGPADAIARDFRERDKGQFTVRFEGHRETDLAYRALDILGEAYEEVRGRLRVVPATRIEVVIYTGGKYRAGVAGPDWSLARYDGKIRVGQADLMAARGVLRDTLYHEYAHALLSTGVGVPPWFHEGVAQYLEPSRPRPDRELLARAAAKGELSSFAELGRGFLAIDDARLARLAYVQSLSIVEFMAADRGEDRLHGTIRQLAGGARFDAVVLDGYGERLERRWLESLAE